MIRSLVQREDLVAFLEQVDAAFGRPGRVFLIGETSLVFEGWQRWMGEITFCADVAPEDRAAFKEAIREAEATLEVGILEEFPGDLIPLPEGYADRALAASVSSGDGTASTAPLRHLELYHFDPYSVAFRYIARGDEPDYHLVLTYLQQGWIRLEEMENLLKELLPRFSFQTIQQDPAEFRRKYKGMTQMWRAVRPGVIHRHTPA